MGKGFETIDIGIMVYYLGIEVKQKSKRILYPRNLCKEILRKFQMLNKPVNTPTEYRNKFTKYDEGDKIEPTL